MLNISLAHNWLKTSLSIVKLQAALVQALPPNASPLQQLPGVTVDTATELEIVKGVEGKKWAEKAIKKDVLEKDAKVVAEVFPRLDITNAEFKGELYFSFRLYNVDARQLWARSWSLQVQSFPSLSKLDTFTRPP